MGVILLLVMIGVPILEIAVFIEVGGQLGLWPTVGIVILTAVIGTALLRYQGLATLFQATRILERGQFPMAEVFDGLCLVLAGALLLTPGFITDGVGFLLFFPPLRRLLRQALGRYFVSSGRVHVWNGSPGGPVGRSPYDGPGVIEGEFERHEPDDEDPSR